MKKRALTLVLILALFLIPSLNAVMDYDDRPSYTDPHTGLKYELPMPAQIIKVMPTDLGYATGGTWSVFDDYWPPPYPRVSAASSIKGPMVGDPPYPLYTTSYSASITAYNVNFRPWNDGLYKQNKEEFESKRDAYIENVINREPHTASWEKAVLVDMFGGYGYTQVINHTIGNYSVVDCMYECYINNTHISIIVGDAPSAEVIIKFITDVVNATPGLFDAIMSLAENRNTLETPYAPPSPPPLVARPTSSAVKVNGKNVDFDAYNINDNNYFKLRDLAYTLSGSEKQFDVVFDSATNTILLTSNKEYTVISGEMQAKGTADKKPVETTQRILLDGTEVKLKAYNIDGNNYFMLRDIGSVFDFGVVWDGANKTIIVDTATGYTPG